MTATMTIGDVFVLTTRRKHNGKPIEEYRIGIVVDNGDGWVNYAPYYGPLNKQNHLTTGQGRLTYAAINATPFGVIACDVVGQDSTKVGPTWRPRPGDRGYDPNC